MALEHLVEAGSKKVLQRRILAFGGCTGATWKNRPPPTLQVLKHEIYKGIQTAAQILNEISVSPGSYKEIIE